MEQEPLKHVQIEGAVSELLDISHLTGCYTSCLQRNQLDVSTVIPPQTLLNIDITFKLLLKVIHS